MLSRVQPPPPDLPAGASRPRVWDVQRPLVDAYLEALPAGVAGGDFQPLAVSSLDQLRLAFAKASPGAWTQDQFTIRAR